jgi:hypothetical protein
VRPRPVAGRADRIVREWRTPKCIHASPSGRVRQTAGSYTCLLSRWTFSRNRTMRCLPVLLIALLLVSPPGTEAQSRNETERLAALGQVWGFLKYFHPDVAAGTIHWDIVLVATVPKVRAARTDLSSTQPSRPCSIRREACVRAWIAHETATDLLRVGLPDAAVGRAACSRMIARSTTPRTAPSAHPRLDQDASNLAPSFRVTRHLAPVVPRTGAL